MLCIALVCYALVAIIPVLGATSPKAAVAAAYYDAVRLPPHQRLYTRYVWWPTGDTTWVNTEIITKGHQTSLSDQGPFPQPVRVCPGLYRLDATQSGWDRKRKNGSITGLQVWEKFAPFNFFFTGEWQFLEDTKLTFYFPPGLYETTSGVKAWYGPTKETILIKAGKSAFQPAPWANPLVEAEPEQPPTPGFPKGKPALMTPGQDELKKLLSTEVPIVMAPWWLVRTSRQLDLDNLDHGFGYYNVFGIKNRNDFFDLIGVDFKVAQEKFTEFRELAKRSGISNQVRIVGMIGSTIGKVTFTLDFKTQKGRGQPARNLLPGEADHDAEEWIGPLPSGYPGHALVAAKAVNGGKAGDLQATAPDFIGGNRSTANKTNDLRIHVNSCWDCHSLGPGKDGLIDFSQWARKRFRPGKMRLEDKDPHTSQQLQSLYLRDLDWHFGQVRQGFARTIALMTRNPADPKDTGWTMAKYAKAYTDTYYNYVWPKDGITPDIAAAELGVTKQQLLLGLKKYNDKTSGRGLSDNILSSFLEDPPEMITRMEWEDSYQLAMVLATGNWPPELVIRADGFDTAVKKP